MPDRELPYSTEPELSEKQSRCKRHLVPLPSPDMKIRKEGYGDCDNVTEGEEEGRVVSPPRRFLDTQYGIRREGEQLMIGDSPVFIDPDDNVTIREQCSEGRRRCGNYYRVRM